MSYRRSSAKEIAAQAVGNVGDQAKKESVRVAPPVLDPPDTASFYSNSVGLTEADVRSRLVNSPATANMTISTSTGGSYNIRYAYVSQRGYYPDALNKANQDSFVVTPQFFDDPDSLFVGVFDGHGTYGDLCSLFVADRLPPALAKAAAVAGGGGVEGWRKLSEDSTARVTSEAHVKVNEALHDSPIDDTLSGTTAISVLLKGELMFVNNVGDSRAIICSEEDGVLRVKPLSLDQTPFRRDERERIKRAGGKVMTIDQIDGMEPVHENWDTQLGEELDEVGDPPRVWCATLDKPGCAFTRSLGDSVGESVGVFAEPEQMIREVSANDRFVVVASDGVFEFLTSQMVQDIICKFDDPLEAAKYVVQQSFRLWLQYEVRTDDITIIIITFDSYTPGKSPAREAPRNGEKSGNVPVRAQRNSLVGGINFSDVAQRPVRRYFSKEAKSRLIKEAGGNVRGSAEESVFDFKAARVPKSAEDSERITDAMRRLFLFRHLTATQLDMVVQVMTHEEANEGDTIIKQGDEGDKFYVVDSGTYDVFVSDRGGSETLINTIVLHGASFGELSLMYGKPRTATVRCIKKGWLWALERRAFRGILVEKMTHANVIKVLRKVKTLKKLSALKLQQLCEALRVEEFEDGAYIAREGEVGSSFYIVDAGEVSCCMTNEDEQEEEISRIGKNGFFGETALVKDMKKTVSFVACGAVKCLVLRREDVEARIGRLMDVQEVDAEVKAKTREQHDRDAKLSASLAGTVYSDLSFSRWSIQLGNFGFVAVMEHKKLGTVFTIKLISKRKANEEGQEDLLRHERAILKALTSPCLFVPTLLYSTQDSRCFFQIYRTRTVCDLLTLIDKGSLPVQIVSWLCACVANAIVYLHEEGIIHRRVTPQSVYITDQGVGQLSDLSCGARMTGSKAYTMIGDPQYLAPEQISGQGYGSSIDYWAFGILTYEMLMGKTPFGSGSSTAAEMTNETEVYMNISCFEPSTLKMPGCDDSTLSVVQGLMATAPESRLGYSGGTAALRRHPFFEGVSWSALDSGQARAPSDLLNIIGCLENRNDPEFEKEFLSDTDAFDSGNAYSSV